MRFRVGRPGSGKTLVSVRDMILAMRRGVPVYSNVPIIDPVSGRRSGLASGWQHVIWLTEYLGLRNFAVLVDEGNVWACSRRSKNVALDLLAWWAQRRHYGAHIIITAQHENRIDVVLRETVDYIDVCERMAGLPRYVPWFRVTPCYPEDLEAMRSGQAGKTEWRWLRWWAFAGYSTIHNVKACEYVEGDEPSGSGLVHPNYLPGVPFAGKGLPRSLRESFTGPRQWDAWVAYLDEHPELSPPAVTDSELDAYVASEDGILAIQALATA